MALVELNKIFDIYYGNKFDANKMEFVDNGEINFISRIEDNNGCVGIVNKYNNTEPFEPGLITVSLGGSILSSFLQPKKFYTAQNIAVLRAKKEMSDNKKIFYCKCISMNRFKYSTFGREANRTIKKLKVPNKVPAWVKKINYNYSDIKKPLSENKIDLNDRAWKNFVYQKVFDIERGRGARETDIVDNGKTRLITAVNFNNGLIGKVNKEPRHRGNVLTVARNGSYVGQTFYQTEPFCSTEDVHIFNPKFILNPYIAMFLIPLITKERYRYSYGRKWGLERMNSSIIKLPVDKDNNPDWQFMEDYIKSLKYSAALN